MKKFIILSGILLSLSLTANATTFDYAGNDFPPLNQPHRESSYDNLTLAKVTQVEQYIFGQTYPTQKLEKRLNNLEKTIFNRTYSSLPYKQRMDNIMVNYINYVNHSNFDDLSKMENSLFNRNFKTDMVENRIARLETRIFGTIQSGDLTSRYSRLQAVMPNYISRYANNNRTVTTYTTTPNPQQNYRYPKQQIGSQMLSGLFNNLFVGTPTGITPPLYQPYGSFDPDFQRGIQTRHGWYQQNRARSSGAGVQILD